MMYSSLPSASKIYVSSAKPRQKNVNSAKRKRRKLVTSTSTPVRSNPDEETLVSSTNIRKSSLSQISGNDYEESLEFELSTADEDSTLCTSAINGKEHVTNAKANCFSGETINELDLKTKPCQIISDNIKYVLVVNDTRENEKSNTFERQESDNNLQTSTDSFVNQECNNTTDVLNKTALSNNDFQSICVSESNQISELAPNNEEISDKVVDECLQGGNLNNPVISVSTTEITPDSNNSTNETINSNPNIKIDSNNSVIETAVHCESTQTDLNSTLLTLAETSLNYEKNDILPESSALVSNKCKNLLGDNLNSDHCDSSSVRSDCCISTNIYHDHIDNSEHSSLDENEANPDVECDIKSPSQSEVSCTESTIHNGKSACQTESVYNSCSTLERGTDRKISPDFHQDILIYSNNFPENSSHSVNDLQKIQPSEILRRTVSLPENYSKFTILRTFNYDVPNSENVLSANKNNLHKSEIMFDKYTSTSDFRSISTDKSTLTPEGYANCKKDASTTPIKQEQFISKNEKTSVSTSFKENSMLIMKVLPPIGIMQARARSYVFGSVSSTGSLLGSEELSRFFPGNKVTVFVGTWNMNGHDTPESIDDFLLPLDVSYMPDIYAIGVQESMQSRSEWEIALQTTLGPSHVLFASTSFGVLHLSIFMRRDLIWFCSEPEEASIATRPGSMIKTKGAVAMCFMFFGTSFLFVNSHLTAHEQKLKERLSDYEKICSSLDLPKQIPLKSHQKDKDVTSRFDCVFWCGDLNFRVIHDRPSVISFVEEKIRQTEPSCNLLMKHDQLSQAMAKGTAFNGFNEGFIKFIPSYKFNVGTSSFDSTKLRVPSYTDRILYRSKDKSSIVCLHYDIVPEIFTSDHKPVYAIFNVSLKPGRDNIPLAAGLFKRDIYLEAQVIQQHDQDFGGNDAVSANGSGTVVILMKKWCNFASKQ